MKILLIVATTIGMLGLISGSVLAQSGNELFSQALLKERTEGNPAEAIKVYQTIVAKYPNDRSLVARALLQMGLCYEKLGHVEEARRAFDRVLREHKDQKNPAAEASARLAELDRARFAGQGGVIRGRVTDRGQPVHNAQAFAMKLVYVDGRHAMMPVLSVRTNLLGEYDIAGLRPGNYYVAAVVSEIETGIGAADNGLHVSMYFPGTTDWRNAKLAEVRPGTITPNVNIDVAPVPVRRVRGTVTGIMGGDALPPTVQIKERDLPFPLITLNATLRAQVDPGGSFELPRIPAGSYVLYASQMGRYGGHVNIEVRDRDVDGVGITMTPGFTIAGRIEIESQAEAAFLPIFPMTRVTLRYEPSAGTMPSHVASPRPDGSFRFAVDPNSWPIHAADYRVSVEPLLARPGTPQDRPPAPQISRGVYVKSIRLGEVDVLNDGLHLTEQPQQELVIVIGANPGTIEGRVVNARKEPVPVSAVVLIPEGRIRFRVDHKFTATDASGSFRLERIPPGDYKVFAWQGVENGEWQDPDFVRPYESMGKLIHIKEGERQVNVEVVGIPPKR